MKVPSSISDLYRQASFQQAKPVVNESVLERGDQPPIRVKSRPVLALDKKSGTYKKKPIAPPKTPPTSFSVTGDEVGLDGFATLKDNLYESFDSVAQVSTKLRTLFGRQDKYVSN